MVISEKIKDIARWGSDYILKNGGTGARVSLMTSVDNALEYRINQIDKLQQSSENKLFLEIFIDGRYGSFSTNRLEKGELEGFIKEGIRATRLLSPDICRQLPNQVRYYKGDSEGLDSFDENLANVTVDEKISLVKETIGEILEKDKRLVSVSSYLYDSMTAEYIVASNGFEGMSKDSACSLGAEASLKTDGDARPEGYWSENAIFWDKLPKKDIASKAYERAVGKIGQMKIKSGKYNVLFDNRNSSRLLSPLISAMYGSAIQQKNSFLLNRLGEDIASPLLSLKDTPHLKGNFGARWYDGEGVTTRDMDIIKDGILNIYFIDTYNSLKMNIAPTISSPSILEMKRGEFDFTGLMKKMGEGIWITGFNGGNCNPTTGDFSFGIEGFAINNGSIAQPVAEMNITGNILEVWKKLAATGSDPRSNTSARIPSLLFNDISFSGI